MEESSEVATMCGRFTLQTNPATLAEVFACEVPPDLPPRYNITPTQPVAVVRAAAKDAVREFGHVRWGLVPSWASDPGIGARMINARAETVAEKPAFRTAFRRRRCLVLADGYFEWQKAGKIKQPFYIRLADQRPFAFAGLWEQWSQNRAEAPMETCTIITTAANELMRPIHDRMPAILSPAAWNDWLAAQLQDTERLRAMLKPYAGNDLIANPVETYVNSPRNDDPRCIAVVRSLL